MQQQATLPNAVLPRPEEAVVLVILVEQVAQVIRLQLVRRKDNLVVMQVVLINQLLFMVELVVVQLKLVHLVDQALVVMVLQ